MQSLTRVWVCAKPSVKEEALAMLEDALRELGFQVAVHPAYPLKSASPRLDPKHAVEWADFTLVVGGDGTLLRVFHETQGAIPLLGVNSGDSVGYLMDVTLDNAVPALQLAARGECSIDTRLVGEAFIEAWRSIFVNEAAVLTSRCGTLLRAKVFVDDEPVMEGRLDGIIVATPTGSTAYALSAGGPILDPLLDAFAITPLAPFSAFLKPYVVSADRKLSITIEGGCSIVIDGALARTFDKCTITVVKAPVTLRLIKAGPRESLKFKLMRRLLDLVPSQASALGSR